MLRWSSDKAKRLTQVTEDSTPWTPQFDRAGNMTHAPKLAVDGHPEYDYAYDLLNWLTSVTRSSDDELVATFAYDALGRRIEHVNAVLSTTTRYYYDGANEIVETDESDTRLRWYVHGLSYIDERLMMFSEALGLPYYYAIDKDYSVRALVDKTGAIIERYCYDPYGNPLIRESAGRGDLFNGSDPDDDNGLRFAAAKDACTSGCIWDPRADIDADGDVDGDDQDAFDALVSLWNDSPTVAQAFSGVGNPFAFQGRPHFALDTAGDAPTATVQLLDHRNRFMDPILGRWLTRDPIGYADGMNLYQVVRSNLQRLTDPDGLLAVIPPLDRKGPTDGGLADPRYQDYLRNRNPGDTWRQGFWQGLYGPSP